MLALISCGEGDKNNVTDEGSSVSSSSPSGIITKVINNVSDGDYEAAIEYYVRKNGSELTKEDKAKLTAFLPSAKDNFEKKGGVKEVKIVDEKIADDGNSAEVKYQIIFGNDKEGKTERVKFIKVDGDWKVRVN